MRFAFAIAMVVIAPSAFAADPGDVATWRACFAQRILETRSVPDERLLKRLETDCRREHKRNCTIEFSMGPSNPRTKQLEQSCVQEAEK